MATDKDRLQEALKKEQEHFHHYYLWVEAHLPAAFFEEVDPETIFFIVDALMGLEIQGYLSHLQFKDRAVALCLEGREADLSILRKYRSRGIKYYKTFLSNAPPPFPKVSSPLRIAIIYFTQVNEKREANDPEQLSKELLPLLLKRNASISRERFLEMAPKVDGRFLRSLTKEEKVFAFDLLFRAEEADSCQLEMEQEEGAASLQIILAWSNVPKHDFLFQLARIVERHRLTFTQLCATYIDPYGEKNIFLISLGLRGIEGKSAWETAELDDFIQELMMIKCFQGQEEIERRLVENGYVSGNLGNLLKAMAHFIHQGLSRSNRYLYSFALVEEALCRHPELSRLLTKAFEAKFHPKKNNLSLYEEIKEEFLTSIKRIDTGQSDDDMRRKTILMQGLYFVDFSLKNNFYRNKKSALSFRIDPRYLEQLPDKKLFPETPFALFFFKGVHFIGFHIRFRELARGGLRTVLPEEEERYRSDRDKLLLECYNLAYTQQKKNKDIPEGGAKGIILLKAFETLQREELIYRHELLEANVEGVEERVQQFKKGVKKECLYQAQRSYIESMLSLVNCDSDGKLKADQIVDYYGKPEYIYLGPDENMENEMIRWICRYATHSGYLPGRSFMSSHPESGINHKEFGVTSRGVNIYMEEVLKFLHIDPHKNRFTIKMSGGPDGDVAGNQICNLYRFFPQNGKLVATIDVSGTLFDPEGVDLSITYQLFRESRPIRFYPAERLSEGGYLLDTTQRQKQGSYQEEALLMHKQGGKLISRWISGNEMNHLLRTTVHQAKAEIFIPGGGRPFTLNEENYQEFLDKEGKATSKAIVEGGNLYLSPGARRKLEQLGVIIIKDSSANKGGVICSSYEVLSNLVLSETEFAQEKSELVKEIIAIIEARSAEEAKLLLSMHGSAFLTDISDQISERINLYTDEIYGYLEKIKLSQDKQDPLMELLFQHLPPLLRKKYADQVVEKLPDLHKKAIIACSLAQRIVYKKGISWSPSIVDMLPNIARDAAFLHS